MPAHDALPANSPLALVLEPPLDRERILRVALAGFSLVVGLVLLAAFLGYRGSDQIQETAQSIIREDLVHSGRGAALEKKIVEQSQDLLDSLAWVLGVCFLLAAATAGMTVWIIRRAFTKLEWQAAELAHVSWHMIDTHEKMARRFSHEMHDELGQSLGGLRRLLGRIQGPGMEGIRQECIGVVDEVLENVRKLSQVLRPVILDDFGLDSGLRWLCDRFGQRTQVNVRYTSNFHARLAEPVETHLFRIAQEALTNIARHSGASGATMELCVEDGVVRLTICDNGSGLAADAGKGGPSLGMVGMRARARQIGGELTVENRKEGGLRIRVEAPVRQAEQHEQEDTSFAG